MGFLLEAQNEPETAIIFFKQSVNIREGIRRDIQGLSTELQQSYTETILGRRLKDINLVVLSACETALGDEVINDPEQEEGVEINSLSYYFLAGGVESVMASLWKVDDNGTSELMQKFYAKLSQSNQTLTKAEALRQVQLNLLNNSELKHPHYWSPFILMGNGI